MQARLEAVNVLRQDSEPIGDDHAATASSFNADAQSMSSIWTDRTGAGSIPSASKILASALASADVRHVAESKEAPTHFLKRPTVALDSQQGIHNADARPV